ncbi:MAG: tetratricopeptide repeat protein [Candidatus Obscuribacterales bacterium]|nr:tetratricopeptide repeat protein [Candidatus Obscuribacterales bacterium]
MNAESDENNNLHSKEDERRPRNEPGAPVGEEPGALVGEAPGALVGEEPAETAFGNDSGGYSKHSMHGGDAPTLQVRRPDDLSVQGRNSDDSKGGDPSVESGLDSSLQAQMPASGSEVAEGLNNWSWSREGEVQNQDDDVSESGLSAGSFGRAFENGDTARVAGVTAASGANGNKSDVGANAVLDKGSVGSHMMSVRELSRIKQEKRQQEKSKLPKGFVLVALASCALMTALNWSSLIGASDRSLNQSSSGDRSSSSSESPNNIFAAFSQIFQVEGSEAKLERLRTEYQRAMSDLRLADAQKILDQAISIRREANLLRLRARLNFRRGKREEAFSDWTEALTIAPGDGDVLKDRAWAYCRDDSLDLALADYSALAEQQDMKLKASGLAGKALVFSMKGNNLQAENFARQALSIEPETAKAHEVLGNCLQKQGDLNGALSEYTAALRIDRSIPEAYSNRALAYLNLGLKESALGDLETVVRLEPDNDHYRFLLGRLAYTMGRKDLAEMNLKEAVKLNSSNRKARQLLEQVSGSLNK